jgi:tetratricopeptide (TPR) repeat protein
MRGLSERMDRLGVSAGFKDSEAGRGRGRGNGARTGAGTGTGVGTLQGERENGSQKEKEVRNHHERGNVDSVARENDVRKGRGYSECLTAGKNDKKENERENENDEDEGQGKREKEGEKEEERVVCSDNATLLSLLSFRASLYSKLDQHTQAISDLTEAIDIPEIHRNNRETVHKHGNSSFTGKDYRSNLYFSRGLSLKRVGTYPEAVCDFSAAIELYDRHPDTSTGITVNNCSSNSKSSSFTGSDGGDADQEGDGEGEVEDGDRIERDRDSDTDIDTDCHINNSNGNNSNNSSSTSNNDSFNSNNNSSIGKKNTNSGSRRGNHRSTGSRRGSDNNDNNDNNSSNSTIDDKQSKTDSHTESTYCRTVMRTKAVTHRAYCQRKLGNFRESLDDYTTVILLSPKNIQV